MKQDKLIAKTDGQSAEDATAGLVAMPITLANANAMNQAGADFIAGSSTSKVELDMAKVEANTVAIAVTLAWLGAAGRQHKELCLSNLSADFSRVIEFSGINSMFTDHITSATTPTRPSGGAA